MHKRFGFASGVMLGILFVVQLSAQEASPARETALKRADNHATTNTAPAKTVKVSILKSWGDNSIWDAMSTNWQNFGKIPVSVDDTYINSDFTYQNLVNSKANVIVLSNPAGGKQQYSSAEIAAVAKYAKKGHTVLGTYLVFQWSTVDNRGLAPVFGLSSKIAYTTNQVGISNLFVKKKAKSCLLRGITGSSWQSDGYPYTEVPATGNWTGHLGKAKAVAESDNFVGLVSLYTAPTYTGVLVSNFPEYNGGTDDEQLLYNAVTCYVK
ncbi:MAG TPA: hypothetical protein VNZ03_16545 [Terriglobales bacterium]|nr:hypothetical protein [Terriglobales bacterium]